MLALASVYTECCPRGIVTLGEGWCEQKQSLVSLSFPIHPTKPVCVVMGGWGETSSGFPGMWISGHQMSDASFLIRWFQQNTRQHWWKEVFFKSNAAVCIWQKLLNEPSVAIKATAQWITLAISDGGESLASCKRSFSQHGVQMPPSLRDVQHSSGIAKLLRRQQGFLSVGVQKWGNGRRTGEWSSGGF